MSGHSKWSQIKHKKAATDAKRGVLFGKFAQAITLAARENPDPEQNSRLKDEIARARAANMPNDSIERAIKRVAEKGASALTEIQLELLGPSGTAILVSAITDNSNRTINELRKVAEQLGGTMASPGAVSWMFERTGVLTGSVSAEDNEVVQLAAIDAGADEVRYEDGVLTVLAKPEYLTAVTDALALEDAESTVTLVPQTMHPLPETDNQQALERLVRALDDHDDTQRIVTNADYNS